MKNPLNQFNITRIFKIFNIYDYINITDFIDINFYLPLTSIIFITNSIIYIIIGNIGVIRTIIKNKRIDMEKKEILGKSIINYIIEIIKETIEDNLNLLNYNRNSDSIPNIYITGQYLKNVSYVSILGYILLNIGNMNIIGLIPYSFTTTSHISINLTISLIIIIGIIIIGLKRYKHKIYKLFIPPGLENIWVLKPLIFIIELISFISRIISLSVRLTANMLSGHILLFLISSISASLYPSIIPFLNINYSNNIIINIILKILTTILPLIILIPFYLLELGIAIIQAYVFFLLTLSYLKDILFLH